MRRESVFKCSASIRSENRVAISACTNLRRPNPRKSNSRPFTTLNPAIPARPVWCERSVINSRDYHKRQGPDAVNGWRGRGIRTLECSRLPPSYLVLAFFLAHAINSNSFWRNQIMSYTGRARTTSCHQRKTHDEPKNAVWCCERDHGLRCQPMVFHAGRADWHLTGCYWKGRTSDICGVAREGLGTFDRLNRFQKRHRPSKTGRSSLSHGLTSQDGTQCVCHP